jgi:hypothetical protein
LIDALQHVAFSFRWQPFSLAKTHADRFGAIRAAIRNMPMSEPLTYESVYLRKINRLRNGSLLASEEHGFCKKKPIHSREEDLNTSTIRTIAVACACAFAPAAFAASNDITVTPTNPGVVSAAGNTSTGAPGFGSSSFSQNGDTKGELYISAASLFGHSVTVGDIASVSYWTDKPGASDSVDWSFYLYTALQATGNTGSFYHTRLTSEPLYSGAATVPANTWHEWTSGGAAPMRFYDSARDNGIQGTTSDPTLADIESGAFTWSASGTTVDYRDELINFFSLQTGSAWSAGFLGLVDGLTITLTDGEVGTVDLAADPSATTVPEPESIALLGLGMLGALAARRRNKRG